MKYGSIKYFLLLIFLLTGSGCEKYVNYVNSPEFEQKIVITSFISPSDNVSKILVNSNQPLYSFSEKPEDLGDITGTISDGTNEVQLDTTSNGFIFNHNQMPVVSGKTYTLKVHSSKGLYAEAKANVPQIRGFLLKVDTVTSSGDVLDYVPDNEFMITVELTDYPGERNFYTIIGKFTGYKSSPNNFNLKSYWFEYFNDRKAGPDNRIRLDSWSVNSNLNYDSAFITVYLLNTEESFYLYHTSLKASDYGDNPFSEAKPVYSNVNGGLGIFASYTMDSLRFRLK